MNLRGFFGMGAAFLLLMPSPASADTLAGTNWEAATTRRSTVRPVSFVHESLAKFDALQMVNIEYGDARSSSLSAAHESSPMPLEMTTPQLAAGIIEAHHVARQRIAA